MLFNMKSSVLFFQRFMDDDNNNNNNKYILSSNSTIFTPTGRHVRNILISQWESIIQTMAGYKDTIQEGEATNDPRPEFLIRQPSPFIGIYNFPPTISSLCVASSGDTMKCLRMCSFLSFPRYFSKLFFATTPPRRSSHSTNT